MQRVVPGASPGKLHADPDATAPEIEVIRFNRECFEQTKPAGVDELPSTVDRDQVTWVHVVGLGDVVAIKRIGEIFGLHPLALEDVVNQSARSKLDEYDSVGFFAVQSLFPDGGAHTRQAAVFWGEGFVVTFQTGSTGYWGGVRERLKSGRGRIRSLGPDYLAYALVDATIDHFFPVVEERLDQLADLEEELVLSRAAGPTARLTAIKHDLVQLRRAVFPLREALSAMYRSEAGLVQEHTKPYVRDALDHVLQLIDLLDSARDAASNLMSMQVTLLGQRTNEIMRVLTIIATIFIPLTFIAGVYGMNFAADKSPLNMPELRWYYGYPAALLVMATVAGGLLFFFYRRGWIGKGR
ncbi:MAG: magnesium/cobalt transporter CorA [bacterium]